MGQVIAEIRILDGSGSIKYYAIWNNTTDQIQEGHPLFDSQETAELYLSLLSSKNAVDMSISFCNYHSITNTDLLNWMKNKLMEE